MAAAAADKGTVFILAPNDATARAIADAFAADPAVTKSYVTGQDADKASVQSIIDGRQGMTVFKDPRTRVQAAVAAAVAFLKGGTPVATTSYNNGAIDVPSKTSADRHGHQGQRPGGFDRLGLLPGQRLHRLLAGQTVGQGLPRNRPVVPGEE